jgi:xylan 1,4-beta-xylosidase
MKKMRNCFHTALAVISLTVLNPTKVEAQDPSDQSFYQEVKTYTNPVLPGDHPDPTLLKVGDDFYHCGSTFHFTPYMPIYQKIWYIGK